MSETSRFEYQDRPEPPVTFEEVGDNEVVWEVNWPNREEPTPKQFDRLGELEVQSVILATELDGELGEKAEAVHEAVVELNEAMIDHRDLDDEQRRELTMGNLDALPEVEKR